jgi:hypothetical protein
MSKSIKDMMKFDPHGNCKAVIASYKEDVSDLQRKLEAARAVLMEINKIGNESIGFNLAAKDCATIAERGLENSK